VYRRLFRNGALVRALLSFGAAYTAEWAFTVAISLVAYADGGAVAVGLVGLLRLVPAALLAPVVSTYADRLPREKVLFVSSAVRGLATVLTAPILIAGGPTWIVYALAIVSTIAFKSSGRSNSTSMPIRLSGSGISHMLALVTMPKFDWTNIWSHAGPYPNG